MKSVGIAATVAVAIFGIILLNATTVDARRGGGISRGGGGFSMRGAPRMGHRAPAARHAYSPGGARSRTAQHKPTVRHQGHRATANSGKKAYRHGKASSHADKKGQHKQAGSAIKKQASTSAHQKSRQAAGNAAVRNLPVSKAVAAGAATRGRVAVPKNLRPKLTLINAPHLSFRPRLAPFVQRHWRRAFFWAAVAGIGYLTIPQLYYERFYGCTSSVDPDYDCAVDLLSAAALEEEQEATRVHYPMPSGAEYRYSAKLAPKSADDNCSWGPFVERKWSRPFVWVQIPEVGNVTVPEDYYDRFLEHAGQEAPDYPAACRVLVEAVAADTVAPSNLEARQNAKRAARQQ